MPRAYSEDLRRRVVADVDKGLSIRAAADKYSVSPSFVSKITCLWRQEGSVSPRKIGGWRPHALKAHVALVRGKLLEDKGITLVQLRDWIEETVGVRVHMKPSAPRNAATTSPTPDMYPTKREML
jgi:putative transposase